LFTILDSRGKIALTALFSREATGPVQYSVLMIQLAKRIKSNKVLLLEFRKRSSDGG
jgi:hypothetical protein